MPLPLVLLLLLLHEGVLFILSNRPLLQVHANLLGYFQKKGLCCFRLGGISDSTCGWEGV